MSEQPRRHLPVSEKVAAVKRHLLEGTPVSQLCEELGVKPTVFYTWQKLLFENAHLAFENGRKSKVAEDVKEKKIELRWLAVVGRRLGSLVGSGRPSRWHRSTAAS